MLWLLLLLLLIAWILAFAGMLHMGGFGWLLLAGAVAILIIQLVRGPPSR